MNTATAALTKIDDALAAYQPALRVGARFTRTDARGYTNADGSKGVHGYTLVCEITAMQGGGFKYVVAEVVAESGRPAFGATPTRGSMTWRAIEDDLAAGRSAMVN